MWLTCRCTNKAQFMPPSQGKRLAHDVVTVSHPRHLLILRLFLQSYRTKNNGEQETSIFSTWIFYEYIQSGWFTGYSFRCQPVDYSYNPKAMRMANTCWWYYFSKFTEFFDTLFFILRKKNSQVSNLHVIHHGIMPFSVWLGLKFAPGGHSTFFAFLNTFVHIVMYFYYMVSAMGPKYQKYIWWKKYLTTFQMVQFVAIFAHQFQLLFTECNYPKHFMVWIAFHGVLFLFLFSDFYKSQYLKGKPKPNAGACMPLEDDGKKETGNGTTVQRHQFECNNEYSKAYTNCYTDSSSNGNFVFSYASAHRHPIQKRKKKN
ncbi:predicted protein [Pediculus humanus corporis]|uniref:Elongation of very long chain fatty acids protein n=1 Tax=Pediculus humanus subsp. corporis TaxID=121224 RepID=E0VX36_PEDHC|nr:uncharacterized protein Phum_PHUM494510 [Pediculus humanus corporis]EEB17942.1 predicted protein [Pediculus humanus corporis]